MKKIILIALVMFAFTYTASAHHNNHNRYSTYKSCSGGNYSGYSHGNMSHGSYTYSRKQISHGVAYAKLTCYNGKVSRTVTGIGCYSGYSRDGLYCKKKNNSHSRNSGHNIHSCSAGTYKGYSHGFLNNGVSQKVSKNISNGVSYVKIKCVNGKVSRKIRYIKCNNGYSREGNYCKQNSNSQSRNNNQNTCNAGTYNGYAHGFLNHGESTNSSKPISNGRADVKVKCKNGNLSRKITRLNCDSGYKREGNYCKQKPNQNSRTNTHPNSCNAGTYNGYPHGFLSNGNSTHSSKDITHGMAYVNIVCTNSTLSRTIIKLSCDNGFTRVGNYCKVNS